MTKLRAIGVATLLSLAAAAPALGREGPQPAAVVNITFGLKFEPPQVRVRAGEAVEWRNKAFLEHTVSFGAEGEGPMAVLPEGVEPFDSGPISAGGAWRHTFEKPGRYPFVSRAYAEQGMRGMVIVVPR